MIKKIIALILANSLALYISSLILEPDFIVEGGWQGYLIAGIIFGILNSIVKPILKVLSLPIVFLSMGLFIFAINGFLLWFAKYSLDVLDFEGVKIIIMGGIGTYMFAAFVISVINGVISWLLKK